MGYFRKSRLTNCTKMRILKVGGGGGGITIQTGILHVLLNILSVSSLSWVSGMSGFFEIHNE